MPDTPLSCTSIYSSELEYGTELVAGPRFPRERPSQRLLVSRSLHRIRTVVQPFGVESLDEYGTNGNRLYEDMQHAELSLAECDTPEVLDAKERAGDRFVHAGFSALVASGWLKRSEINRRVVDSEEHTWGYHLNVRRDRRPEDKHSRTEEEQEQEALTQVLATHGASIGIIAGAGCIAFDEDAGHMRPCVAQKSLYVDQVVGADPVTHNMLVNSRDEPHGNPSWHFRQHITCLDPSIFPTPNLLKPYTYEFVMQLEEHGLAPRDHLFVDPIQVARTTARDTTMTATHETVGAGWISALNAQRVLLERTKQLRDTVGIADHQHRGLALWEETVDHFETRQQNPDNTANNVWLFRNSDWLARKISAERVMEKRGIDPEDPTAWEHPEITSRDLMYGDLDPKKGIGRQLCDRGVPDNLPAPETIEHYITNPPANTRAFGRSERVKEVLADAAELDQTPLSVGSVVWNIVRNSHRGVSTYFSEPRSTMPTRVVPYTTVQL